MIFSREKKKLKKEKNTVPRRVHDQVRQVDVSRREYVHLLQARDALRADDSVGVGELDIDIVLEGSQNELFQSKRDTFHAAPYLHV